MFSHLSSASKAEDIKEKKHVKIECPADPAPVEPVEAGAEELLAEVDKVLAEDDEGDMKENCKSCGTEEVSMKHVCEEDEGPEDIDATVDEPTGLPAEIHDFFRKLAITV